MGLMRRIAIGMFGGNSGFYVEAGALCRLEENTWRYITFYVLNEAYEIDGKCVYNPDQYSSVWVKYWWADMSRYDYEIDRALENIWEYIPADILGFTNLEGKWEIRHRKLGKIPEKTMKEIFDLRAKVKEYEVPWNEQKEWEWAMKEGIGDAD